jgi:bifunctional UDP-N-acetylglucosamine pyrophosphorylase/glucosamine-1-phosphate N-acetyltransferase
VSHTSNPSSLPVVILAAGSNSRFFPLNSTRHKGLIPLLGKPLIVHQLENLRQHGLSEVYIIASSRDLDQQELSETLDRHGLSDISVTLIEQKQPLGMGDALLQLDPSLLPEQFAVVFPYHVSIGKTLLDMLAVGQPACVAVTTTSEPWLYGIVEIRENLAQGLIEKPERGSEPSDFKVQGAYLLNKAYLTLLKNTTSQEYSFESALNALMQQSPVGVMKLEKPLASLKYPWHLFALQSEMMRNQQTSVHPSAHIAPTAVLDDTNGPIVIDEGVTVSHASRIVGPTYLGKNSFVGDFSLIRASDLEAGVSVGVHSDITRSLLLEHASFHGGGFIGDSILDQDVKVGSGLITANKRFDRASIVTQVKDKKTNTNTKALGAIVGAKSKLGIRVSTMPGIMIGANQIISAGAMVSKNMPHEVSNISQHEK